MNAVPSAGPSRRNFLSVAGIGALALFSGGALAGCGQRTTSVASNASEALLPTHMPLQAAAADIPGTAQGVPSAFYKYPAPFRSVQTAPLKGGKITAITNLFGTAPNARADNPAWQAIEARLGGQVDITSVSSDDYATKFNTIIAGGELPDLMLNDGAAVPNIVEFLQAKCADLTPLLGGDKIKDYPNLAAIPEVFWKQTVQAGKLYSLPIPRNLTGGSGFVNQTLLENVGVKSTEDIKDKDDFYRVAKELTNPPRTSGRWAAPSLGSPCCTTCSAHRTSGRTTAANSPGRSRRTNTWQRSSSQPNSTKTACTFPAPKVGRSRRWSTPSSPARWP